MKWFTDFFAKKQPSSVPDPMESYVKWGEEEMKEQIAQSFSDARFNSDLFDLCWDREALLVEIETAKKQKKKSSHLIAALARNTQRRLELELAHNGKSSA